MVLAILWTAIYYHFAKQTHWSFSSPRRGLLHFRPIL